LTGAIDVHTRILPAGREDTFGHDRVVLGGDYPLALGTEGSRGAVTAIGLPAGVEPRLVRDNAPAFLGLS
jgi:hypothetical protein